MKTNSVNRRDFLAGTCISVGLLALGGASSLLNTKESLLRPPGGQDELRLASLCIRCDKCRQACPRMAIRACTIEDGLIYVKTPSLFFDVKLSKAYRRAETLNQDGVVRNPYQSILDAKGIGFCDFCMKCVEVCPTGALTEFDPSKQKLGIAVVNSKRCLAFSNSGGCRKCVDYCPFGAITLDDQRRPVVSTALCNGCGICENICPTDTYRSFSGIERRGINVFPEESADALASVDSNNKTQSNSSISADSASVSSTVSPEETATSNIDTTLAENMYVLDEHGEGGQDR